MKHLARLKCHHWSGKRSIIWKSAHSSTKLKHSLNELRKIKMETCHHGSGKQSIFFAPLLLVAIWSRSCHCYPFNAYFPDEHFNYFTIWMWMFVKVIIKLLVLRLTWFASIHTKCCWQFNEHKLLSFSESIFLFFLLPIFPSACEKVKRGWLDKH